MRGIVQDCLTCGRQFIISTKVVARVGIAVPARKIAAGDIQANAVPLLKDIACCPEIDFIRICLLRYNQRWSFTLCEAMVAGANDAIGEIACVAIGMDIDQLRYKIGIGRARSCPQMQIYRTLERLVEQGKVSVHEEIQHDRPNRKVYTVTDAGRAELRHWLTEPQAIPIFRDPLLIQLFFAAPLPNAEIIQLLEQRRAEHHERLLSYQQLVPFPLDTPVGTSGVSRRQMLRRLTLEQGLKREQAYIDWLDEAIEVVRRMPE
jgi:PadR family transcriptional regulator AphA